MNYYKFSFSSDPKKVGRRIPQISEIIDKQGGQYNTELPNSINRINPWNEVVANLNAPNFVLHGHAKRTDILSAFHHSHLMVISKRLKALFEEYKLPKVQVFETKLISGNKLHDYYLFYLPDNFYQFIDCVRSTFALVRMNARAVPVFTPQINSLDEFEEWIKEYPYLIKQNPKRLKVIVDKLVFDSDKIPYDMFRILGLISGYFVSERLKNAIEEKGYTGMDFIPLDKIETVLPPV